MTPLALTAICILGGLALGLLLVGTYRLLLWLGEGD